MKRMLNLFFLITFVHTAFAQSRLKYPTADTLLINGPLQTFSTIATESESGKLLKTVPSDLYTHHLGFFCRQELKMQRAHIPVTFRLGSMNYCNYLEQKPGYKEPTQQ